MNKSDDIAIIVPVTVVKLKLNMGESEPFTVPETDIESALYVYLHLRP